MTKVSIIIPMYNEQRYIGRCLDSLLTQTEKDFEIILIDDGSHDNSIAIAKTYENSWSLTILEQQHGGPGKARNRGATIAKGEILVFVDADMAFDERYLEELIKPIETGKETGTAHGREYIANKHNRIARAYGLIRLAYDENNQRSGVFRAIRKDVFLSGKWYDNSRYAFEDDIAEWEKALYVPGAICYHNNPEGFGEIFSHEVWIGESLIAKGKLREYLHKYRRYLIPLIIVAIAILVGALYLWFSRGSLLLAIVCVLFFIIMFISTKRAIRERYLSHILFIPLVMFTRWTGYLRGMVRYLFSYHKQD